MTMISFRDKVRDEEIRKKHEWRMSSNIWRRESEHVAKTSDDGAKKMLESKSDQELMKEAEGDDGSMT